GLADGVTFTPAGASSVVVWGTALTTNPAPGGVGFGAAHLVLPDGSVAASTSLPGGVILVLRPDEPVAGVVACTNLADPASGEYRFVVKASDVEPDSEGLTFRM